MQTRPTAAARCADAAGCWAQLSMRVDEFCSASCVLGPLSEEVAAAFRAKIDDEYRVNMCAPLVPLPPAPAPGLACRLIAAIYAR